MSHFSRRCRFLALATLLGAACASAQQGGGAQSITTSLLSQNRPDDAMRSLEARIGTNPFDAVSMNNLAVVKASRNDWYGAAELLSRAHRLAPDNGIIGGNLGQLNEFLARRAAPAKPAAVAQSLPEGAVWPEPPALWQGGATAQVASADAAAPLSSTAPAGTAPRHRWKRRRAPAAGYSCPGCSTPAAASPDR